MTREALKSNYETVVKNVEQACIKGGRDPKEIKIIAVSKTKPLSMIEDAIAVGMQTFGENKPQEIRDKVNAVSTKVSWHMIGKLQSNKIKYVIDNCDLIHSVDRLELVYKLEKEAIKRDIHIDVLLQVNITGESSKSGFAPDELLSHLTEISKCTRVHVKGLMTIPPYTANPEDNRQVFRSLKQLFIDIKSKNIDNVNMIDLSMGMTGDYMVAREEGATFVRVGTGIFGERNYNK